MDRPQRPTKERRSRRAAFALRLAGRRLFLLLPPRGAAALGLPGLGSCNCLCSTPFFFSSDDTVSDGTAPMSSQ